MFWRFWAYLRDICSHVLSGSKDKHLSSRPEALALRTYQQVLLGEKEEEEEKEEKEEAVVVVVVVVVAAAVDAVDYCALRHAIQDQDELVLHPVESAHVLQCHLVRSRTRVR